jgi:hypothetical protein
MFTVPIPQTCSAILLLTASLLNPPSVAVADDAAPQDREVVIFDGKPPNQLACDTTLRRMPDGSWVMVMLGGGRTEHCHKTAST